MYDREVSCAGPVLYGVASTVHRRHNGETLGVEVTGAPTVPVLFTVVASSSKVLVCCGDLYLGWVGGGVVDAQFTFCSTAFQKSSCFAGSPRMSLYMDDILVAAAHLRSRITAAFGHVSTRNVVYQSRPSVTTVVGSSLRKPRDVCGVR